MGRAGLHVSMLGLYLKRNYCKVTHYLVVEQMSRISKLCCDRQMYLKHSVMSEVLPHCEPLEISGSNATECMGQEHTAQVS